MLLSACAAALILSASVVENTSEKIIGHWKGIEMFQDENSYDGKTFYLPNKDQMVVEPGKVKIYFYPYFKSDEFDAAITTKSIAYSIGRKKVRSDYSFMGDTLVLSMNFINKTFIKMYTRTVMDQSVIEELDTYGFNPSSLTHEFEIDTLHPDLQRGYKHPDSVDYFIPKFIQFLNDDKIKINRGEAINFTRGYQSISFLHDGTEQTFRVYKVEGTQQFTLIPTSSCNCDTVLVPYLVVPWANRIRARIEEDSKYPPKRD